MTRTGLAILVAVAALAIWAVISLFESEPTPAPVNVQQAATVSVERPPTPLAPAPVAAEVPQPPDAPPTTVNEVIPDVPQSALDTIRGTVRVSIRVTIDKQGAVVDATAEDRGPSRYFERLSMEAAKQWTFTPARSDEPRMMLVRFNFTRAGASADASPLP